MAGGTAVVAPEGGHRGRDKDIEGGRDEDIEGGTRTSREG